MDPASKLFIESFGSLLLENGALDQASLDRAVHANRETGERFDHILTRLGLVSEVQLAKILSRYLSMPLLQKSDYPETAIRHDELKVDFLRINKIIPVAENDTIISVGMADPFNRQAVEAISYLIDKQVECFLALNADFEVVLDALYNFDTESIHQDGAEQEHLNGNDDIERLKDLASEAPIIQLVNQLIQQAVEQKASDVHIEPLESSMRVRFRIDGVLKEFRSLPFSMQSALATRIKILGKLNIAEKRKPQDGRIKIAVRGQDIDIRLSTAPTYNGESIVLRILDQSSLALDFETLGFYGEMFQDYQKLLNEPNGIILVTGPTGSGKTTTLYTSLNAINNDALKIFTVEDPIEYQLAGINQLQVQPKIELTFASALRSILRQDPDIIMIGEIRDLETAQIAIQSALTGHLVLSTLHTNSAVGTVTRLLDMGLEDYLLASTIKGIMAQRLVRKLCDHCSEPVPLRENFIDKLGPKEEVLQYVEANGGVNLRKPVGCPNCNYTGFKGRTTIMELLLIQEQIQDAVLARESQSRIEEIAIKTGMKTMYQDGLAKALLGLTTIEEVLRLTRSH